MAGPWLLPLLLLASSMLSSACAQTFSVECLVRKMHVHQLLCMPFGT